MKLWHKFGQGSILFHWLEIEMLLSHWFRGSPHWTIGSWFKDHFAFTRPRSESEQRVMCCVSSKMRKVCVLCGATGNYGHCTVELDFTHCHARSIARSSDPDRGRAEKKWSLNADPRSASDPDPSSRVESPNIGSRYRVSKKSPPFWRCYVHLIYYKPVKFVVC